MQSQPLPGPVCDIFYAVCPNAECPSPGTGGQVQFLSPNSSSYAYVRSPFDISIQTVGLVDDQYPRQFFQLYYRPSGTLDWKDFGTIPRGTNTVTRTLDNEVPGSYEVFCVN